MTDMNRHGQIPMNGASDPAYRTGDLESVGNPVKRPVNPTLRSMANRCSRCRGLSRNCEGLQFNLSIQTPEMNHPRRNNPARAFVYHRGYL